MQPASLDELLRFFFRPQGRLGRQEYSLGILFILALDAAAVSMALDAATPAILMPLIGLAILPLLVGEFVLAAKRCHALGLPGSFVVVLFVPILGLVCLFALMLVPGNPADNVYGPAPPRQAD